MMDKFTYVTQATDACLHKQIISHIHTHTLTHTHTHTHNSTRFFDLSLKPEKQLFHPNFTVTIDNHVVRNHQAKSLMYSGKDRSTYVYYILWVILYKLYPLHYTVVQCGSR